MVAGSAAGIPPPPIGSPMSAAHTAAGRLPRPDCRSRDPRHTQGGASSFSGWYLGYSCAMAGFVLGPGLVGSGRLL